MDSRVTMVPLAALCGMVAALVFRTFGSRSIRPTIDRIQAHLIELVLFIDEPRLILRAQANLLRENLRLLRQFAIPLAITAPLFAMVMWQAGKVYGRAPLVAGKAVVVTAHGNADTLEAPADVAVETPGVRVPGQHEVSWRIRPKRAFSGRLMVNGGEERVDIPWPRKSWMPLFLVISMVSALITPLFLKRRVAMMVLIAGPVIAAQKPPVILISIDTLRADHLSAYGYTKMRTPNIDSFGDKGTIYTQIDAQVPLTLPSHASLMTSTYPFENRVEVNGEPVPAGAVTLASVLRANGYRTAAFIGSLILDRANGLDQGFDVYDSPFRAGSVRRDASLVIRAARQWLEKNAGQPVFAFLHLYDLHTPYTLPQVAGLRPNAAGYDAELQYIDQTLGRFREALVRDGWWDKALVIVLADHGESLGDHGETSHGYFAYESTIHVPLIFHWPAGSPRYPERATQPSGLIDVAPAILDFLHIPEPPSFEGASLLPGRGEHAVYSESIYPLDAFGWAPLTTLRSGSSKYINAPRAELYDLAKDPGEKLNILATHADEANSMKARINELLARYPPKQPAATAQISARTREILGSLGYTAGGKQIARRAPADPKDKLIEAEAYENGLTFLYSGKYVQAIAALGRITAQDPHNLPAQCALGEAYLRSGNTTRALTLWQGALEKDPNYRPAADSIGEYWLARRNIEKACRFIPSAPECSAKH
jgi:tetratricopeptide (TPR) repeat protein